MAKSRTHRLTLPSLIVFLAVEWGLVLGLYSLGWSALFTISTSTVLPLAASIIVGTWFGSRLLGGSITSRVDLGGALRRQLSTPRFAAPAFKNLWLSWGLLATAEIAVSGRLPLLAALSGGASDYRTFGIPSLHGLLLALGCALALLEQALRLSQGKQPVGPGTIAVLLWLLLIFGRKQLVVIAIQLVLLLLASGRVRMSFRQLWVGSVLVITGIVAFGYLGQLRSGDISISDKLRYTGPQWMPDSLIWFYAYATTPFANLASALQMNLNNQFSLPLESFGDLIPRVIVGGDNEYDASQPWLLSSSFNVSTGFIDPYLDGGIVYIIGFAAMIGLIYGRLTRDGASMGTQLAAIACYQCALAMLYANNFSNLNNVSQIPILIWLGRVAILRGELPDSAQRHSRVAARPRRP